MAEDLQELSRRVAELTERVYQLEQRAGVEPVEHAPPAPAEAPSAAPPPATITPPPVAPPPRADILPTLGGLAAGKEHESLESAIGSRWFNRIGIVAVLVGVSYFLKYAFENNWIGAGGRIAIGLIAGLAVVVWSERFRSRGHLTFSWSLKAVGIGTMYLSLWAGFQLYHLFPATVAFAAMVLVTAATAALAVTQDAQVLAALALVGGFGTPLLLSTGQNREVVLFTYVAVLDIAALLLLAFRPWIRLLIGTFTGTLVLYVGWYTEFYTQPQLGTTLGFATLFFAIFALAPLLVLRQTSGADRRIPTTLILIPLVNAAVYFFEIYVMLEAVSRSALAFVAVGLAAVYLMLSREAHSRTREAYDSRLLNLIHIALAVGFLTAAIPLKLETHWITIAWFIEAAVLMWISYRAPNTFVRALATAALLLGVGRLVVFDNFHPAHLVANARFATYAVAIATLAWSAVLARRASIPDARTAEVHHYAIAIAVILINVLALLALNFEVHDYFQRELEVAQHLRENYVLPWADYRELSTVRDFSYSAVWMIYGALLMWVGFARRSAFLRWQALVLIAVTIGKVFIYDVSQLDRGYRIISFIALGGLLLAVSFIYQRDWLGFAGRRGPRDETKGTSEPA